MLSEQVGKASRQFGDELSKKQLVGISGNGFLVFGKDHPYVLARK